MRRLLHTIFARAAIARGCTMNLLARLSELDGYGAAGPRRGAQRRRACYTRSARSGRGGVRTRDRTPYSHAVVQHCQAVGVRPCSRATDGRAQAPRAKKIDALVAVWRDYRATLRAHGAANDDDDSDEPAATKPRSDDPPPTPSPGDGVSPKRHVAPMADSHGRGDAAEALSAV